MSSNDNNTKRKVYRTVSVRTGNGPPQAMTPEAAARYIQQATSAPGREGLKISFGPSRPPTIGPSRPPSNHPPLPQLTANISSSNNNTTSSLAAVPSKANNNNTNKNHSNKKKSINFGNLDMNAIQETTAALAAKSKKKGSNNKKNTTKKDGGLPVGEAEMKALMSMFMGIVGMSPDGGNNNNNNKKKNPKGPLFNGNNNNTLSMPPGGWDDEAMAAAATAFFRDEASWEAIQKMYGGTADFDTTNFGYDHDDYYDDDDDDYDSETGSIPSLEDMRELFNGQQPSQQAMMAMSSMAAKAFEESLEKAELNEALEAEGRARKAAKKREKKQRRKQKLKEEAAIKAAEAAQKKREKAILSWRSRVVSACQSNEVSKLESLLQESPLLKLTPEEEKVNNIPSRSLITPHLEFLLPNSVAKNRAQLERGKEARQKLAEYILTIDLPIVFTPLRSGRTAMHTACFHGDVPFLKLLLDRVKKYQESSSSSEEESSSIPESYLNITCDDSGWSPLHYAVASGSTEILELLLEAGCDTSTITDDTHTWRKSDGKGITPKDLIPYIQKGNYEDVLETHGVALQEMAHVFFSNQSEKRSFLKILERVLKRIVDVETNGYSPPTLETTSSLEETEEVNESIPEVQQESASTRKRKKKKKKKKQQQAQQKAAEEGQATNTPSIQKQPSPTVEEKIEDPLVTALMGMGFTEDQINAAVKACGGTNRATADDLVTWILGQDADGNIEGSIDASTNTSVPQPEVVVEAPEPEADARAAFEETKRAQAEARAEAARLEQEEAARRLVAKREEQRRRNREWNNREQARQQEAAKAKIVQTANPRPTMPTGQAYASAYPSLQSQNNIPNRMQAGMSIGSNPAVNTGAGLTTGYSLPAMQNAAPSNPMNSINYQSGPMALGPDPIYEAQPKTYSGSPPHAPMESKPPQSYVYTTHGDDDRTVSSFGSTPGLSVSSNSFVPASMASQNNNTAMNHSVPTPPPGFKPPRPATTVNPPSVQDYGEIRATAKAFVPTSMAPSVPANSAAMPPLAASFANVPSPASNLSQLAPGLSMEGPSMNNSSTLPPGLLPTGLGGAPGFSSTIPSIASNPPVSQSTGLAGLPLGFGMENNTNQGTSSLLDSFSNGPPVNASSIWGETQAKSSFGALPAYSIAEGRRDESNNELQNNFNTQIQGWGGSSNPPPAGGQGSIW